MPLGSLGTLGTLGSFALPSERRLAGSAVVGVHSSGRAFQVRTSPQCVACGAEPEPPVRAPHTVYVKTLHRIAGQDCCRHHVIGAAVDGGVITEVRTGAGPVATASRE